MQNIKHSKSEKGGRFYLEENEKQLAEMVYVMGGDRMIIEHTDVDDSMRGKGIGKNLLGALVEFARENKIQVIPLCPFANAVFQKTTEWQDVLAS